MNFSTAPMDTGSERALRMHALSHKRSCGHTRLQISGMLLVERESAAASRNRPSAVSASHSGIRFASGQPFVTQLRIRAIDAPTGLRARGRFIEQAVDLIKVTDAFAGSAFRRSLARNVTPVVFDRPARYGAFHLLERCRRAAILPTHALANAVHLLAQAATEQRRLLNVGAWPARNRRNLRLLATRRNPRGRKATPFFQGHGSDGH